ncbi:hypothetical protein RND71_034502 [Anisodus tanguticus]|uniref:Uncharacterized protein n=1 Tax=Anisodus tanguticus TaxID=243964 RepID=A0AAE1RAU7_9SOLA|nr:hypothetical protein RND71_034502 [Anisodus tanguticus]
MLNFVAIVRFFLFFRFSLLTPHISFCKCQWSYWNLLFFRSNLDGVILGINIFELGLVLFAVAKSTVRHLATVEAIEKTTFFAKGFGGSSGKLIQETVTDVSSSGLNHGIHISGRICQYLA